MVRRSARLVFEEEFGVRLSAQADLPVNRPPQKSQELYFSPKTRTPPPFSSSEALYVTASDLVLPASWCSSGSTIKDELVRKLRLARQQGFSKAQKKSIVRVLDAITSFQDMAYLGGALIDLDIGQESSLQKRLRDHMRSRKFQISEEMQVGGGRLDLLFENEIVVEVKIYGRSTDFPLRVGPRYALQGRRYALALAKQVIATVVGYKPKTELGHRAAAELIDIRRLEDRKVIEIRASVPIGYPTPSRVRAI